MSKPARHRWSWADEELLRRNYATSLTLDLACALGLSSAQVLRKANAMGLRKSVELIAETARERSSRPGHGSLRTRIQPGTEPWNKGIKGVTGTQDACRATQFKPGHMPHTWMPVGTEVVNADGVLDRKISEDPGPRHMRWKPVHRLVWEAAHGPVPAGHVVVFRPGRKTTDPAAITLDALELLSRSELMRRQSVHALYPPELGRLVLLRGALQRQIKRRQAQVNDTSTDPTPETPAP